MNKEIYPYDYNKIHGFGPAHDFAGFYEKFVDMAPPSSTIVEIGCFFGRSLVQLGQYARHANKGLRIVGVDHMTGQSNGAHEALKNNLAAAGLSDYVEFLKLPSARAAELFEDGSVFMAFIDANHEPLSVEEDVVAWMPRIAPDGWIAGHDARWYTVWWAINALIPNIIHDPTFDNCWFARKAELKTGADIAGILNPHEYHHRGLVPTTPFGQGDLRNDGQPAGLIHET